MTRLIDADVMLEELKDKEVVIAQQNIADLIDEQPTVDAEIVRHGTWIMETWLMHKMYCSVCGAYTHGESPYCYNCGAKMDGE